MEKTHEEMKRIFESKLLLRILCGIGILIVASLIFFAGIVVGFNKASFGRTWGQNYNENFGMGHQISNKNPMMQSGMMDYFPNSHGATGKIIKIDLPNIIVDDKDNTEKTISIGNDTDIEQGRLDIKPTDLKVNATVVVIGTPDDKGVIEAKFIRVIPVPESLNQ